MEHKQNFLKLTSEGNIVKYKNLKQFFRKANFQVSKDEFFALISLMKIVKNTAKLGFYDFDCTFLVDVVNGLSQKEALEQVEKRVSVESEAIDRVMDKIYSPSLELDFSEMLLVFKLGEFKSSKEIFDDIIFYLELKGVSLNEDQLETVLKIVENGQFKEILQENHKEYHFKGDSSRIFKHIEAEKTVTNNFSEQLNPLDDSISRKEGKRLQRRNLYHEKVENEKMDKSISESI